MPTKTKLPPRVPRPPGVSVAGIAAPVAAAAGAALAELLAGLFLGALPLTGRAEAFPFLLCRPWLVLVLALAVSAWSRPRRLAAYAGYLLLAGSAESLALHALGNPDPWPEMLRGLALGGLAALAADLLIGAVCRRGLRWAAAMAVALAALLAVPAVRGASEKVIAGPAPPVSAARPAVALMTALPLIWGEGGAFDPGSRPAAVYPALRREFDLRPIDALSAETLSGTRLLLLAQPRWLAPRELVALDDWVRRGGRALILTDPALAWPSELPLGDVRRPPPVGLLAPLLGRWGMSVEADQAWQGADLLEGRLLRTQLPGRIAGDVAGCELLRSYLADCRIGAGRALLLADADLLRDDIWVAPGRGGGERIRRRADNPLIVADLLDGLAGIARPRALGEVRWTDPANTSFAPLLWALLLLAALSLAAGVAALLPRRAR